MHSACLCVALTLVAAEPGKADSELVQAWLAVGLKHAQDYTICPADNPDEPFSMMPHAIFRHNQPIRGDDVDDKEAWSVKPRAYGPTLPHWSGTVSKQRLPEPADEGRK